MAPSSNLMSAIFILSILSMISCGDPGFGACPEPRVQANFDPAKFTGFWYEIEDYHDGFFGLFIKTQKCSTVNITLINPRKAYFNSSTVIIITQERIRRFQEGRMNKEDEPARWTVFTRPDLQESPDSNPIDFLNYSVLETDYTSYALVYACSGTDYFHTVYAWILSREDTLSHQTLRRIHDNLDRYGLNKYFFRSTVQNRCAY